MAVTGIENVLQQLQATALSAANLTPQEGRTGGTFSSELKSAIDRISDNQNHARLQAQQFEMGVPGVALNDVMLDLQKASVSLQMGVQVRNRLVAAYQDIMNMPV